MTEYQISLVQESFASVAPIADAAAELFYNRLFELDPELREMFTTDLSEQGRKLMAMLGMVVGGLNRLDRLTPAVEDLGRRHVGYRVKNEQYATVGEALLWTLEKGLGEAFTPDVREAWTAAYGLLASVMTGAADRAATDTTPKETTCTTEPVSAI